MAKQITALKILVRESDCIEARFHHALAPSLEQLIKKHKELGVGQANTVTYTIVDGQYDVTNHVGYKQTGLNKGGK